MPRHGWRKRWAEGQAQSRAANVAELDRKLEGPRAEQRLRRIQARFQQALAANRPSPLGLGVTCVLVFLTVLTLGLLLTG